MTAPATKPKVDRRFLADAGTQVFDGNELLIKGALEAEGGVHLLTGYPGSPLATFFDVIREISPLIKDLGIYAHQANNEALAAAMLNGSQMHGLRGLIAMKSVGLHVAADALALGNLVGAHPEGGAIICLGDDPWSESTQVPADSRYLCEHLRMPVIEPADAQEVKDWIDLSFKLSRRSNIYVGYMMTPLLADGGGTVVCKPNRHPLTNTRFKTELETAAIKLEETVLLPPRTGRKEEQMAARIERMWKIAEELGFDRLESGELRATSDEKDKTSSPLAPRLSSLVTEYGFIACGEAYQYLRQAMVELGIWGQFPILKLGLTYPINPASVEAIAGTCRNLVVVEERRGFVENQVGTHLLQWRQAGRKVPQLWGKHFPGGRAGFPDVRGLNIGTCIERLANLLDRPESAGSPHPASSALRPAALARFPVELNILNSTAQVQAAVPLRTPTFCPGCPHRDSANVFLEIKRQFNDPAYMKKHHRRGPIDLVFHGDTGCYTMLMFAPNEPLMHNYSGMGLGAGTGAGIDPFIKNKQVVFMGDGTFFHSGMIAISNAVKARQDIAFIILDNRTTAMTGHQSHPGTEDNVLGDDTFRQSIDHVVRGLGTLPGDDNGMHLKIARLNPENRGPYKSLLEETILSDGVKVIIADKECGITFHRRRRRQERAQIKHFGFLRKKTYMNVTPEVCEMCLECTRQTGCPGLTIVPTDHGPKMQTDLTTCVNDGACARIDACPSFEQLTVIRKRPPLVRGKEIKLENLPEPKFVHGPFAEACGTGFQPVMWSGQQKNHGQDACATPQVWRAWLAGVGGMGIGLASAILVRAGWYAGYHVRFSDKKGLAIRNGGVFSSIVFAPDSQPSAPGPSSSFVSAGIPYGKADVLIGVDILEAARAVDPKLPYRVAHRERTAVVVNTGKTPTIYGLLGREGGDYDVAKMENLLREVGKPGQFFAHNVTEQCERLFGTKLYANIAALGVAYQMGLIPIHVKEMEHAIHDSVSSDHKNNLRAFNLGRKLVAHPEEFDRTSEGQIKPRTRTLAQVVREKALYLNLRKMGAESALKRNLQNGKTRARLPDTPLARQYKVLVITTLRACRELDKQTKYDLAVRIYDLIQYDSIQLARKYCELIRLVFHADDERQGFAVTRSAVWNLARLMVIKDEFYVATLLTSYEKFRRDRQRFNVNVQNGDRIHYKRVFHPRYFGIKFSIPTPNWVLYVLRRLKFLRKVLPGWHRSDKQFLQWYVVLLERFYNQPPRASADYQRWLSALSAVDEVNGFREYREPKLRQAQVRCEQTLAGQATAGKVETPISAGR